MRIAALLAVLALAACGSGSPEEPDATPARTAAPAATKTDAAPAASADEQAIRDTLDGFVDAVRAGDTKLVCARYTARELIRRIQALGGDCVGFTQDRVQEGGPRFRLEVSSVTVTGDRAMVRARAYESDGPRSGDTPMVREGGQWRMTLPRQP